MRETRALADDHSGAGQRRFEKDVDVLLDRDPADVKPDGAGQAEIMCAEKLRTRMKKFGIDARRPENRPAEAARLKLVPERGRRRHDG